MKQRVISAIVMLLLFIPLLIIGSWPFSIFVFILAMIGLHELLKLNKKIPKTMKILTYFISGFLILYNIFYKSLFLEFNFEIIIFLLLIYLISLVFVNNQEKYNYKDAFFLIGITLFITFSFTSFIYIRNLNMYLMIYLFLITTVTDSFALFTGKLLGRHKVAPLLSPNKTIEGCVGGSLFGTIAASIFYIFVLKTNQNIALIIFITLLLTIIGQLGDLIKSSIKRCEGIKDFSNLIPGHGGILDRLDSIIFVNMTYILISRLF